MSSKVQCDYIVSNDVLIDDRYKSLLINDLFVESGKYKLIYIDESNYIVPTISNLTVLTYSDTELIISGNTEAGNEVYFEFSNGYSFSSVSADGTFSEIVKFANIGNNGTVTLTAESTQLRLSTPITKKFINTTVSISNFEMLFNNHLKFSLSTNPNSKVFIKINGKTEETFNVGEDGVLEFTSQETELQVGTLEIHTLEIDTQMASIVYAIPYDFNEVDVAIDNSIIVKEKTYFDGLDIGMDEIGIK